MREKGFTLIELSIVLVIIGLLIGGIIAGKELQRQAQIRAVMREMHTYKTALTTFRSKYNAFPGDMKNAVRFWGAAAGATADGVDSTCAALTTASTDKTTCNGDGNGILPTIAITSSNRHEFWRAWQQLSNADVISGSYSGVMGSSGNTLDAVADVNAPSSAIQGGMWTFISLGTGVYTGTSWYHRNYGNVLYLGRDSNTSLNYYTVLTTREQYSIDIKMDDGLPQSGTIMSHPYSDRPDCVTSTNDAYKANNDSYADQGSCNLIFLPGLNL